MIEFIEIKKGKIVENNEKVFDIEVEKDNLLFGLPIAIKDNIKMLPSKTDYIFGIVNKARKFKSKKII